jgi:membrane-associated phospholipid phosphatase
LRRTLTFALALTLAPPAAGVARAQQPSLRFPVHVWPDGVVIGTTAAATLLPVLWPHSFAAATCAPCDRSRLWAIDRGSVGPVRAAANLSSYGTAALEAGLGFIFLASSRRGQGTAPLLEDATVVTQAVSVTAAATMALKLLFHRPRPLMYLPAPAGGFTPDDGRSFPSSHTSLAFAIAAAYTSLLHRRGIAGSHKLEIGALFTTALATGVLRVVSHEHFPTDVLAGAALGFALGWTVPAIHAVR